MNLSEEQIDQYRKRPKEDIVDPIRHGVLLFMLRGVGTMIMDLLVFRHFARFADKDKDGQCLGFVLLKTVCRKERIGKGGWIGSEMVPVGVLAVNTYLQLNEFRIAKMGKVLSNRFGSRYQLSIRTFLPVLGVISATGLWKGRRGSGRS